MKLTDLPQNVLDDLCQDQKWRLDIDPGFDSKHEFWMAWHHFLKLPEESYFHRTEDSLADFLTVEEYNLLLPVPRSHHASIDPIDPMGASHLCNKHKYSVVISSKHDKMRAFP